MDNSSLRYMTSVLEVAASGVVAVSQSVLGCILTSSRGRRAESYEKLPKRSSVSIQPSWLLVFTEVTTVTEFPGPRRNDGS
jgi:hypothetical protein